MILSGKEDLRVQKTILAIQETFKGMICEMDYEKITVKELCSRAKINKKTFYSYYPSLDDLTAELQGMMSQGYLKKSPRIAFRRTSTRSTWSFSCTRSVRAKCTKRLPAMPIMVPSATK